MKMYCIYIPNNMVSCLYISTNKNNKNLTAMFIYALIIWELLRLLIWLNIYIETKTLILKLKPNHI